MALFVTFLVRPIGGSWTASRPSPGATWTRRSILHRNDELGDLTDAFNDMAHSLREKEL
jgi:HAMP domain-containing protein